MSDATHDALFAWPTSLAWMPPLPHYTAMGTAHACEYDQDDQPKQVRKAQRELKRWYEAARKADPRG